MKTEEKSRWTCQSRLPCIQHDWLWLALLSVLYEKYRETKFLTSFSFGLTIRRFDRFHYNPSLFESTATTVKMGCGMSTEDKEGKARNEEIENQLKRDKMLQRNEIKMLLLGTAISPAPTPP